VCVYEGGGVGRVRHVFLLFSKKKIQVCLEATFFCLFCVKRENLKKKQISSVAHLSQLGHHVCLCFFLRVFVFLYFFFTPTGVYQGG
jgi:hypothetical protein